MTASPPAGRASAVAAAVLAAAAAGVLMAVAMASAAPATPVRLGSSTPADLGDACPRHDAEGQMPPQPPAREPAAQPPSFRSTTAVVEVDVIVRDGQRRFVDDLTAADFEVLEDGKPQAIRVMYLVRGSQVESRPPADATPTDPAGAPTVLRETRPPTVQRAFVWVFDQEHLLQGSFTRAQAAVEQFLKTGFRDGDMGGVLMGATMVGNRLTANRDELLAAIRGTTLNSSATSRRMDLQDWPRLSEVEAIRIATANDDRILDQVAERALRETAPGPLSREDMKMFVTEKARSVATALQRAAAGTLRSLDALVTGLARFPGRKTVVFISEGFQFEQSWGELRQIVARAARAHVRIYAIDALGLRRRATATDLSVFAPLETGGEIPTAAYDTVEEGPNTLAVDTGGYVVRGTNDFAGALAEVSRDTSEYYVLGYSPTNPALDGSFRAITVKLGRHGLDVRARKGYLASPAAGSESAPPAVALGTAGAAPGAIPPAGEAASGATVPAGAAEQIAAPAGIAPAERHPTAAAPTPPPGPAGKPGDKESPGPAGLVPPVAAPAGSKGATLVLRPDAEGRVKSLAASNDSPAGNTRSLAAEGWERYQQGNLEDAARRLGQAAVSADAAPWVRYALGFAYVALGRTPEAAASWEQVREVEPAFEAVYLDLADAYVQIGDPGRAVEVLREAETRWPSHADVLNALGTVQVRRGALNDALQTFERVVASAPADPLGHFNLGRTLELRYYQMRRFSRPDSRWVANEDDLKRARQHYETCVRLGGPYEADARAALERIGWRTPLPPTC